MTIIFFLSKPLLRSYLFVQSTDISPLKMAVKRKCHCQTSYARRRKAEISASTHSSFDVCLMPCVHYG